MNAMMVLIRVQAMPVVPTQMVLMCALALWDSTEMELIVLVS